MMCVHPVQIASLYAAVAGSTLDYITSIEFAIEPTSDISHP